MLLVLNEDSLLHIPVRARPKAPDIDFPKRLNDPFILDMNAPPTRMSRLYAYVFLPFLGISPLLLSKRSDAPQICAVRKSCPNHSEE